MFKPNEAAEDFHFLLMAISIVLILIVVIFSWSHSFAAIKYKLLKEFGISSQAVVVRIVKKSEFSSQDLSRSLTGHLGVLGSPEYQFRFSDTDGKMYDANILLENRHQTNSITKKTTVIYRYKKNQSVQILYLKSWPELFFPKSMLETLRFDWTFFSKGILALVMLSLFLYWRIRKLIKFRRNAKFY